MWLERNTDRHGREEKDRTEIVRQRNLREISMWYRYKEEGLLDITEAEKAIFYSSYKDHTRAEDSARKVDMWLSTYRPVLIQCKLRAKEIRETEQGCESEDAVSVYSAPDQCGDDESVESMLMDPDECALGVMGINSL